MLQSTPNPRIRKTPRRFKIGVLLSVSDEEMYNMYCEQRLSQTAIGVIYGVATPTVGRDLIRRGIPIRTHVENRAIVLSRPEFHIALSRSKMGNKARLGKTTSDETRERQAIPKRGKKISEETRKKLRDSHVGQPGYWTGTARHHQLGSIHRHIYTRKDGREVNVIGTYELAVCKYLDSIDEEWEYTGHSLEHSFLLSGGHRYFPDFYLTRFNIYIDPKGYVWPKQLPKYEEVERLYPGRVVFMIGKTYMEQLQTLLHEGIASK